MNASKLLTLAGLLAVTSSWALPADGLQGKHQGAATYFRNIRVQDGDWK